MLAMASLNISLPNCLVQPGFRLLGNHKAYSSGFMDFVLSVLIGKGIRAYLIRSNIFGPYNLI
jgi:hypothetical protein